MQHIKLYSFELGDMNPYMSLYILPVCLSVENLIVYGRLIIDWLISLELCVKYSSQEYWSKELVWKRIELLSIFTDLKINTLNYHFQLVCIVNSGHSCSSF